MSTETKLIWVTNITKTDVDSGEFIFTNGVEGKPQATTKCSAARLSRSGVIGIYKREGDTAFQIISKQTLTPRRQPPLKLTLN